MTTDDLGVQYAAVARQLLAEPNQEHTLDKAVGLVLEVIDACHHAAITVVHRNSFETAAATSDLARRGDELQYELGEGPCLDSLRRE